MIITPEIIRFAKLIFENASRASSTRSFLRDASLPALDAGFLSISGIAYAIVRHGAHAIRTSTHAHRHASALRYITDVVRKAVIAGALIRPGAPAVQARMLAHILARATHVMSNAFSSVGIDAKARIADAPVRTNASAVWPATVSALCGGQVGHGCRDGDTSAGIRLDDESRFAGAPIVSDAHAMRTAAISAIVDGL